MTTDSLNMSTLEKACPDAVAEWLRVLTDAVLDCRSRPSCTKKRSVTLKLDIVPHPNDPDDVVISPVVGARRPVTEHQMFRARASRAGQLRFDFPEDTEE